MVDTGQDPAGFWLGLWQGLISPITFLISLFTSEVNIYEVQNNGNWYDFGFILGVAMAFGGGAGGGSATAGRLAVGRGSGQAAIMGVVKTTGRGAAGPTVGSGSIVAPPS